MKLYLVVPHPQDPNQPRINHWSGDQQLEDIQTTLQIGDLCQKAQRLGDPVFIHRLAWEKYPPLVCCSVRILRVYHINPTITLIRFTDARLLNLTPPLSPLPGQNIYAL